MKLVLAAEFEARAALGFGARETGALEIVSAMLDVGAQLFFHLVAELRTAEESREAKAQRSRGVSYFLRLRGERGSDRGR